MFEAQLEEAGVLKKVLEAIRELLNEANFECTDSGIKMQAMDNSHVSLVSLNMVSDGFETYRCDRALTLGMNLASLTKIMKCASNDDSMTIKANDGGDTVTFIFESGNRVSDFDLRLMNLDQEHLGIPETDYSYVIKMPSGEFARIIRDLSQFGDSIIISGSHSKVKFTATGDIGTANVKLTSSEDNVDIEMEQEVTLTFASKYLSSFAKAAGLSERVTLKMSNDVPLVLQFDITSSGRKYGYIRYYLAPKIGDDDS